MEELRTNVQGVEDKIRRTEKSLADLRRLQQEINSSTSARTTYFTLQQQQYAALSEENEGKWLLGVSLCLQASAH